MSPSRNSFFLKAILTLFLSRPSISQSILATQCYYKSDNTLHTSPGGPCGIVTPTSNFTTCCAVGDTCLDAGLCHYTHAQPTSGSSTGYYVGGCTDQSYESSSCQPACSDQDLTDVVYNSTTGKWNCCGSTSGVVHCNDPTTETFDAPALDKLSVSYSVPSTVVTSAASSTSTSLTASTTSSSETTTTTGSSSSTTATSISTASSTSSTQNSNSGISSGAKAGIGISCAILGIGVSAAVFLYYRKRRSNKRVVSGAEYGKFEGGSPPVSDYNVGNTNGEFYRPEIGGAGVEMGIGMGGVTSGGAGAHGAVEVPGGFGGSEMPGEGERRFHEVSDSGSRVELEGEVPGRRGGKGRSGVYDMA